MKSWSKIKCTTLISMGILYGISYVTVPIVAQAEATSSEMTTKKIEIDRQIVKMDEELKQLQQQLQEKVKEFNITQSIIEDVERLIKDTEQRLDQRETLLNGRMTAYQEQESMVSPYVDVVLGAESFSDFLSRAISVKTIIDADKELLDQQELDKGALEKQQQELEEKEKQLQQQFQSMQEQERDLEVKQVENKAKSLKLKEQIATKKEKERLEKIRLAKEKEAARLKALAEQEFIKQQAIEKAQQEANARAMEEKNTMIVREGKVNRVSEQNAGNGQHGAKVTDADQVEPIVEGDKRVQQVIEEASKHLGSAYVWGGSTPSSGFDCSGLTKWAYNKVGISLPRTAAQQYLAAKKVHANEAQAGDLVFFSYGKGISHVGIYLGEGKMLDAQNNGVVVESLGWWNKYLVGYGRVLK